RLGEPDSPLRVAQVLAQDGERQLLRACALVGPLEAPLGEALDLVVLAERLAVGRNHQAVYAALALIGLHLQAPQTGVLARPTHGLCFLAAALFKLKPACASAPSWRTSRTPPP